MPIPSFTRSTALVAILGTALIAILAAAFLGGGVPAGAADPNPCNPCAAKVTNPCNPCAAKGANPCNPCAGKVMNPCNPCAGKGSNPCNPCGAMNPCNPCGGAGFIPPEKFSRPTGVRVSSARGDLALGEKLWNDNSLSTNGAACATCHMNNAAFLPSFATPYPHPVTMVKAMSGVDQVEAAEMVQFCMVQPMQAEPLPWRSRELAALAAYVQQVQTGFSPNPCALKANPCGANPCAPGGANPCAPRGANPCNPCATKAMNPCNPCAPKGANPCAMKNPCRR